MTCPIFSQSEIVTYVANQDWMEVEIQSTYQIERETCSVGSASRGSLRENSGPRCGARERLDQRH